MKILAQVGSLGSSIIDHLISPLAKARNLTGVSLICRYSGPIIPKVEYHCPPKLLTRLSFAAIMYEFFNLFRLAIFRKPTHLAGFLLFPHGLMAFIIAKLTKKKVILSLIAGRSEFYTHGTIQNINFTTQKPPWFGRLLLTMLQHTDAVVTTGSVTKNFLIKHGIVSTKIFPIISPANRSRFFPVKTPKVYDIVSVGGLDLIKHHEVLLLVVSELKKKYPNIKACIVGDGPRKAKLIKLSDELGIKKNVDFVGQQKDVPHYYNSAKVFVHTSEREGFPNVFLEAMMCGLPCVVSNCGDIIDIARDGINSFVIQEFNDYTGFVKVISNLLEDQELYNNISQNALETMELHSQEDVTRQWELILD